MSNRGPSNSSKVPGHEVDQRLADSMSLLDDALDSVLDIDAGLADARRLGLQRDVTRALDDVVDVDAGLAQILQPRRTRPEITVETKTETPGADLSGFGSRRANNLGKLADDLATRPQVERLTLRQHEVFWSALHEIGIASQLTISVFKVAELIEVDLPQALHITNSLCELTPKRRPIRDLHTMVFQISQVVDREGTIRYLWPEFKLQVGHMSGAQTSAASLATVARNLAQGYALDQMNYFSFLTLDTNPRVFVRAAEGDTSTFYRLFSRFKRNLERNRRYIQHPSFRALELFNSHFRNSIRRLTDIATDMTGADLSKLDLHGTNLEGIRWSRETRWPRNWEAWIYEHSMQLDHGVYEVHTDGTHVDVDSSART